MSWSFIIPTDGKTNIHLHPIITESIINQNIPEFEIIFVTENPEFQSKFIVEYINTHKNAHITLKKNKGAQKSKYDNLCLIHDYISFPDGWYKSYESFGYDWNVSNCKFLDGTGERWYDWNVFGHPIFGHAMVPYHMKATDWHYPSGNAFQVKRDFFLEHPLDEQLCWGEAEDRLWADKIRNIWNYKLNPFTHTQGLKVKTNYRNIVNF